jgi:DNA recombination protein RmuC
VEVQPRSNQRVEFAIKLPGDGQAPLWLPIDAKYPTEDYDRLAEASERGDVEAAEAASRGIEARVRGAAKDICAKYVAPPHTTDFAVMFLPTEGLFAEVIRRPGLVNWLQRECHVMVAGPTTLVSLLTSLRMGFRTLAIQQRSSEVWKVLSGVKAEFEKFGGVLDKIQKKLEEAQKVVEEAGVRRRVMDKKLRSVEVLPEVEADATVEIAVTTSALIEDAREAAE